MTKAGAFTNLAQPVNHIIAKDPAGTLVVRAAARPTAKGQTVVWAKGEDGEVLTDPILLRSILANLLENAVDYTPGLSSPILKAW